MGTIKAMIPVSSSTISAMGHDEVSKTMKVEFKNGSVYQYQNVEGELFSSIVGAESVGKAFDAKIKKQAANHPFTKVA